MSEKSLSHVRLFATLWTIAFQAPLSMEFSRQEYWSGCHILLQGIFLTQGWNPGLPHCRQILYCLNHQAIPNEYGIFPTQGSNPGLLHCRQILYRLSYQGSPESGKNLQILLELRKVRKGNSSWHPKVECTDRLRNSHLTVIRSAMSNSLQPHGL